MDSWLWGKAVLRSPSIDSMMEPRITYWINVLKGRLPTKNNLIYRKTLNRSPGFSNFNIPLEEASIRGFTVIYNRSIYQCRYLVKICSDSDYCNSDCGPVNPTVTPLTLPTIPTIPTMPTIAPRGRVICFNCETSDGSDCQTNSCTATYCLYRKGNRWGFNLPSWIIQSAD